MDTFVILIKNFFKNLFIRYSTPQEINTAQDYACVKKWVKKISTLYIIFTVLTLVELPIFLSLPFADLPQAFNYIIMPPCLLLTNWGYATLITYFPDITKGVFKAGKAGFEIGENFETTYVSVTHDYGNRYSVSSTTENKGCLFGFLAGMIQFMAWAVFCVYIGPFLTFKKLKRSKENLAQYKN